MQFAQRRASRRPFPPLALPRTPHHLRRAQRPSPRPRRPRLRQAPPSRPPPRHFSWLCVFFSSLACPLWWATHHCPPWPPTRLPQRPVGARYIVPGFVAPASSPLFFFGVRQPCCRFFSAEARRVPLDKSEGVVNRHFSLAMLCSTAW